MNHQKIQLDKPKILSGANQVDLPTAAPPLSLQRSPPRTRIRSHHPDLCEEKLLRRLVREVRQQVVKRVDGRLGRQTVDVWKRRRLSELGDLPRNESVHFQIRQPTALEVLGADSDGIGKSTETHRRSLDPGHLARLEPKCPFAARENPRRPFELDLDRGR